MATLKTSPNDADVLSFLHSVENQQRREDALFLHDFIMKITGEAPTLWGPAIVGYGKYHYVYDSGREGDWFLTGFSPRKQNTTIYIMAGFSRYEELMQQLGKHKTGKSCLYVNKLSDIDLGVLEELIRQSIAHLRKKYPA